MLVEAGAPPGLPGPPNIQTPLGASQEAPTAPTSGSSGEMSIRTVDRMGSVLKSQRLRRSLPGTLPMPGNQRWVEVSKGILADRGPCICRSPRRSQ